MTDVIHRENTTQVSTLDNNAVVVTVRETTMELGTPRDKTILTFIRSTYPARYNHVVRNMNYIKQQSNVKDKSSMRGGHFFLYRYVILLAILICFAFGIASIYVKPCAIVSFMLSILYIALSIYNIVIYMKNRPLLHPIFTKPVPRGQLGAWINKFYAVPLNATVLTGVAAAFIDPAVIIAAVQRENIQLTEITIMLYDDRYLSRSKFPIEIIIHTIIFGILFILSIIFVAITITSN
jgi:hypothetical protein